MHQSSNCLHFYRKSADNRLLFGGGDLVRPALSSLDTHNRNIKSLKENLPLIFPQLKGKSIDFAWGGHIAITNTFLPNVGKLGAGMYYANGFSGHGINITHICGKLIADAIGQGDRTYEIFDLVKNMSFPGSGCWDSYLATLGMWRYRFHQKFR